MIAPGKGHTAASLAMAWEAIRNDYDMSRADRFVRRRTGLAPQGNTADWHYRVEAKYYEDIEKARDMDRNDAVVGQVIDRAVANIVQDGFKLDPKTGSKSIDQDLRGRWDEWASDPELCDIEGEFTFNDFESHSMRAMLLDGDCVNLGLNDGRLQHIEAHVVQTTTRIANTVLGVTKGAFGRRETYWLRTDPVVPSETKEQSKPVSVRNSAGYRTLFHVYNPKRMTQTRGVTAFAPIFALTSMFEDINFAKMVQQQVVSCFAIFRQRQFLPEIPGSATASYGASGTETSSTGETRYIENIAPGMEIIGEPGEELKGFSPDVPNEGFFEHVKLMLQLIGVNLGLPLCMVLMDGSETNFSGWRGAVDEARKGFRSNQRNLMRRFHSPLYRWKVAQWIANDPALRAAAKKRDLFKHTWNPPTWAYIDPVNDAQGDALQLQNALTSPRRKHAERGRDWEEVASEIIDDNVYAIMLAKKAAEKINSKFDDGQPVHWRELISLPMPNGTSMSFSDPNASAESDAMSEGDEAEPEDDDEA